MGQAQARGREAVEVVGAEIAQGAGADAAQLGARVEALLISVDRPLTAQRIAEVLGLIPVAEEGEGEAQVDRAELQTAQARVAGAVEELNAQYERTGRAFRVEKLAGGYRVMTLARFAEVVAEFHRARQQSRLSRAAVETLAIVAYKQPVTRAELEAIRGVSCGDVLKSLLERRLVTVKGRAEELGRPMLYGTTKQFLDQFGLSSIKDLPSTAELG